MVEKRFTGCIALTHAKMFSRTSWRKRVTTAVRNEPLPDDAHLFSDFRENSDSAVKLLGGVPCGYHTADAAGAFRDGRENNRPDK